MLRTFCVMAALSMVPLPGHVVPASAQDGKLRIIAFGAHPDDCELTAAARPRSGRRSATRSSSSRSPTATSATGARPAVRSRAGGPPRSQEAARDPRHHHAGARHPRRRARADAGEPPDDHPADPRVEGRHRDRPPPERLPPRPPRRGSARPGRGVHGHGAVLLPRHAAPRKNPVFLYYEDGFTRPESVPGRRRRRIDDVIDKKLAAVEALPSQFYEGGANGGPQLMPSDEAGKTTRKARCAKNSSAGSRRRRTQYRAKLRELYGPERGDAFSTAEAFEISEYGRRPNAEEIKRLFPFFRRARRAVGPLRSAA